MLFSYFGYEGTQRNLADLQEDLKTHEVFQLEIKKQILENQLADAFYQKHVDFETGKLAADKSNSANVHNSLLKHKTQPESIETGTAQNIGDNKALAIEAENSSDLVVSNKNEDFEVVSNNEIGEPNEGIWVRSFEPLAFIGQREQGQSKNKLEKIDFPSEFSKQSFCKSIKWYGGVSGGLNSFASQKNFQPVVEEHISEFHYLLENASLISSSESKRTQFNFGVFGGAQLFDRLDIEGGINYHYSSQEFSSVYSNLYQEEFVYLEWVPTGESNGTNGAPIYKPVEKVDYQYKSSYDTITTTANSSSFEIPLLVRYHFNFNKLSLFASIGASSTMFNSTTIKSTMNGADQVVSSSNNQSGVVDFNGLLGAGISYRIMPNIEIRLEPVYRPTLYSNDEYHAKSKMNSTSWNAGLKYQF